MTREEYNNLCEDRKVQLAAKYDHLSPEEQKEEASKAIIVSANRIIDILKNTKRPDEVVDK